MVVAGLIHGGGWVQRQMVTGWAYGWMIGEWVDERKVDRLY